MGSNSVRFPMVLFISYFICIKWVPKATFRHFSGCSFAIAWTQNLLGFCLFACASKHLFLEFGLVACKLPSLTLRKSLPCLRQLFFSVFSRLQKQRFALSLFGIFCRFTTTFQQFSGCGFAWFGHVHMFLSMDSYNDVSAFFRLRFRNSLDIKPAGVLPFRMRVPNTFS